MDGIAPGDDFERTWTPARSLAVAEGLRSLRARAAAAGNGGLSFLARTLLHFVEDKPVAPRNYPLLVALYLRGQAQARGEGDDPLAIGLTMNDW